MKLNVKPLCLAVLLAAASVASARTNSTAPDNTPSDPPATTTPAPATPPADATPPAANADPAATVPAAPPAAVPAPAPVQVAQTPTAPSPAPAPADATPTARDPNAIIPLIVMDDVPLPDAIKNLARQASLNYMLDPKITAPTEAGPKQQPMVSLRWENLTAEQALNAVLATYNLTMIEDTKSKIVRITIKDPAAPEPLTTKIIQLKYSSATNLANSATSVLMDKRSKVIADTRTSQLIVVATEKEMSIMDALVARLDTPTKQVLIEARIIETAKNPSSVHGIDWSGTLAAQHFSFGNGNTTGTFIGSSGSTTAANSGTGSLPVGAVSPPFIAPNPATITTSVIVPGGVSTTTTSAAGTGATTGTVNGYNLNGTAGNGGLSLNTAKGFFPQTAFLNADGVSAVLSFINSDLDSTVLSTPRAVTLDNEEATLSVTRATPIFKTTAGTQGSPGGAEVTYTNLGTILRVTPRISANNTISLKVVPEVSDLFGTITQTVSGLVSQADVFDIRKIETHVLIPSGNTLVMGGLVDDNRSKGNIKVPFFGDLPLLGSLFRQESKTQNKKTLIIFVTPTIVQNEDFQPTQTDFLKTKLKATSAADFGPWDSGSPQDWSKLIHNTKPADTGSDN